MNSWQKEIEITEIHFYTGEITCKYRGEKDIYLSNKTNQEKFSIGSFYDIQVIPIQKVSTDEFDLKKENFPIINLSESIVLIKENQEYIINPIELYVDTKYNLEHTQIKDEFVHGYFENCPCLFSFRVTYKKIICVPYAFTGNTEERIGEDGSIEIRKERVKNEACELYWDEWTKVPIEAIITNGNAKTELVSFYEQGKATGETETKEFCIRYQYYNSDGSTYWGNWICSYLPHTKTGKYEILYHRKRYEYYLDTIGNTYWGEWQCIQDKRTGNSRLDEKGNIEFEYANSDCTTYWKKEKEIIPKEQIYNQLGCREGCTSIIPILFALAIFIVILSLSPSILPVIIWGALILIYLLISVSSPFIGKALKFLSVLFNVLSWIIGLAFLIFLVGGIVSLFELNTDYKPRTERQNEEEKVIVPEINPIIDSAKNLNLLEIKLEWEDFNSNVYKGRYFIDVEDASQSRKNLNNLQFRNINNFTEVYKSVLNFDSTRLNSIYYMLDSIRVANNLNKKRFADVIVTMVQSMKYSMVLTEDCGNPISRQDPVIRQMLDAGIPCNGPEPFGLITPLDFATKLSGDCDTRTLFLFSILNHFGYEVVIFNSNQYRHSMLGVNLKNINGKYKYYRDKPFYFWETTSRNFKIGDLPNENGIIEFWEIVISN